MEKLVVTRDRFSHLATRLADRDDSPRLAKELETRFAGAASVTTWREETQDLIELQRIRQTAMDLLALAIMAIAATGIANTVLMAADELLAAMDEVLQFDTRTSTATMEVIDARPGSSARTRPPVGRAGSSRPGPATTPSRTRGG